MRKMNLTAAMAIGLAVVSSPLQAAQATQQEKQAASVSLELRDAPVRTTLEAIFKQAGIQNYVIDSAVQGFVTMTLTEQPLESALKLLMRASSSPLTYTVESGVWIVKPRRVSLPQSEPTPLLSVTQTDSAPRYERINLTYLDAADLDRVLGGILVIRQFTRQVGGGVLSGNGVVTGGGLPGPLLLGGGNVRPQ